MKIVAFDLESTDLSASWGRILCGSFISTTEEQPHTFRGDRRPWKGKETVDDSKLCVAIRDELEKADILLSWNGILFDVPLLNARLQVAGERPYSGKTWPRGSHLDLLYYSKGGSLRIGGSSLKRVSEFFKLPNQKTPLDGPTWQRAAAGDKKALDEIVEHCEYDVLVLRDTLPILAPHVKKLVLPFNKWWKYAAEIELN